MAKVLQQPREMRSFNYAIWLQQAAEYGGCSPISASFFSNLNHGIFLIQLEWRPLYFTVEDHMSIVCSLHQLPQDVQLKLSVDQLT